MPPRSAASSQVSLPSSSLSAATYQAGAGEGWVAAWNRLERPARHEVKTEPRQRPEKVKEKLVVEHEYKNIRQVSEDVAAGRELWRAWAPAFGEELPPGCLTTCRNPLSSQAG